MKLTAQEEYGLRCLLQVARRAPADDAAPLSIRDVAGSEGLSIDYTAKLMRVLRQGDLVSSARGVTGGYRLARPAENLRLTEVFAVLGSPLYGGGQLCETHAGQHDSCVHLTQCTLKALWGQVEDAVHQVLDGVVLADLLGAERQ